MKPLLHLTCLFLLLTFTILLYINKSKTLIQMSFPVWFIIFCSGITFVALHLHTCSFCVISATYWDAKWNRLHVYIVWVTVHCVTLWIVSIYDYNAILTLRCSYGTSIRFPWRLLHIPKLSYVKWSPNSALYWRMFNKSNHFLAFKLKWQTIFLKLPMADINSYTECPSTYIGRPF